MSARADSFLIGLIGAGVTPSLTPLLHESEGAEHGLLYLYRPIDIQDLGIAPERVGDLVASAHALGFNGLNITHPCKQLVLEHLSEIDDDARRLRAVNTVVIADDGRTIGYNTDFTGFGSALETGLPDADLDHVVQLGAGGAGSAVGYALLAAGARRLTIVDVDGGRSAALTAELSGLFPKATITPGAPTDLQRTLQGATGLVNCTPIGMAAHRGTPLDPAYLDPRHWVADIIYRPISTALIDAARERGCAVLDGGRMAVGQAVDAFRIFTGREPDGPRMREHFLRLIEAEAVLSGGH